MAKTLELFETYTYSNRPRNNLLKACTPAIVESYRFGQYGKADINLLMSILELKRPHSSKTEKKFNKNFLDSVKGMKSDHFGNRMLTIEGDGSNICWASHVDTVHMAGGTQDIVKMNDIVSLSMQSQSNCLGADDGAGVWLMLEMIREGKPGLYIFHRGEECGGLGSNSIAWGSSDILNGIDAVISLDRYGYESVITHQGGRTASEDFAQSLASSLKIDTLRPDSTGLFTDSANYSHIVSECSNLSVGYFGHHGAGESLNVAYLCALRDRLIALDTSKLVFSRHPDENDWDMYEVTYYREYKYPTKGDNDSDNWMVELNGKFNSDTPVCNGEFELDFEKQALSRLIEKYPEAVAALLTDYYNITIDEIYQGIYDITGREPDTGY